MDISTLQQQWQQKLDQVLADEAATAQQNDVHATTLAGIQDRVRQARGLSRLKNPFIKVTKIAPLHHKQKKLAKSVANGRAQLASAAEETVFNLAKAVVTGSPYQAEYTRLGNAFGQIDTARTTVKAAASACDTASGSQRLAACKNIPGSDEDAADAIKAITAAAQALKALQQQTDRQAPQIDSGLTDRIAKGLIPPPLTWSNFGMGNQYHWDMVKLFDDTEMQLRSMGDNLDSIKSGLGRDWQDLAADIVAAARKTNPAAEKLMASVETCLPADTTLAKPAPAKARP